MSKVAKRKSCSNWGAKIRVVGAMSPSVSRYDGRIVKYRRLPIEGVRGDDPPMNIASPTDPRMNRRAINTGGG